MPFFVTYRATQDDVATLERNFSLVFGDPGISHSSTAFELRAYGPGLPDIRTKYSSSGSDLETLSLVDSYETVATASGFDTNVVGPERTRDPLSSSLYFDIRSGLTVRSSAYDWMPWHFTTTPGCFVVSSHLFLLGRSLSRGGDDVGELQWLTLRYNLGRRTPFTGIARTTPNDEIRVRPSGDSPVVVDGIRPDVVNQELDRVDVAAEACWSALVDEFRPLTCDGARLGLFLSGGLDSRLALAAARSAGVDVETATHGRPGFEEVTTAERAAHVERVPHVLRDLDDGFGLLAPLPDLAQLTRRADTSGFPMWLGTARLLKDRGAVTFTSGFALDASIGGHLWDPVDKSSRLARRLRTSVIGPSAAYLEKPEFQSHAQMQRLSDRVAADLRYRGSLFQQEYLDHLWSLLPAFSQSVQDEMDRIQRFLGLPTGAPQGHAIVREFLSQNHFRGYSLGQERIARTVLPLVLPTGGASFFATAMSVPEHLKVDHHLYFRLMRRFCHQQASLPWSATSLPVTYPIPILELSRMAGHMTAMRNKRRFAQSGGTSKVSRRGAWPIEATARLSPLEGIVQLLEDRDSRVSPEGVRKWVKEIRSYERNALNLTALTDLLSLAEFA